MKGKVVMGGPLSNIWEESCEINNRRQKFVLIKKYTTKHSTSKIINFSPSSVDKAKKKENVFPKRHRTFLAS
jgi:hypothetical protein